ncbi:MAG: hypothetical protein CMH98_00135 [Oceanospirillaceae bacterium]|nr:hypothetical protein [Oceanospirillaceae bacterium]
MATEEKMKKKYGALFERVKKTSGKISTQSLYVYLRNISRLYALTHDTDVISGDGKWLLKKELLDKFDNLDLNKKRLFSVAAIKGLKAYKLQSEEWNKRLSGASEKYDKMRAKRKITSKESARWPKSGYKSLRKAAKDEKLEIKKNFKKTDKTLKDLLKIQNYIILFLYSYHPLRLDFADVHVKKPEKGTKLNYLYKAPRIGWQLTLRSYKTAKFRGETVIKIDRAPSRALSIFVPILKSVVEHDKLLTNAAGKPLSRNGLSKLLKKLTKKHLGTGFSAGLIRVLYSTENIETIEKAKKIQDEMGHSAKQSLAYTRKSSGKR